MGVPYRCVNLAIGGLAIYLIYSVLVILICVNHMLPLDKADSV